MRNWRQFGANDWRQLALIGATVAPIGANYWRQLAISPIGDVHQPEVRLAQFNWRQLAPIGANGETLQIFGLFSKTDHRQLAPIGAIGANE